MSIVPDMGLPNTMSEADHAALPEGVARRIEVVPRDSTGWNRSWNTAWF